MPITLNGTTGITTPTYNGNTTAEYLVPVTGFKNRIINGAMVIDQRNAGASVTPTDGQYTLDRWASWASASSKYTVQQNAASVTPPAGFKNYLGVTSASSYSVSSSDYFAVAQYIEGYNSADLAWGTANAKTVTLSFWVRSSLTGTFGGCFSNGGYSRQYPFSYTISSANTWEQKTITVAGDTSGTWLTTNSSGIRVVFSLGMGSSVSGTAGSWTASSFYSATGATSVVGTNGATFYITGVQLEVGSTATSFDARDYGRELMLCQRYYQVRNFPGDYACIWTGDLVSATSNNYFYVEPFPVAMRAAPTGTIINSNRNGFDAPNFTRVAVSGMGVTATNNASGSRMYFQFNYTVSAEL